VTGQGAALLRRVAREYRRVLMPLGAALLVNVLAYAFIVYPLSQRVANIEQRDEAAARELAAARREHAQAAGTLSGKDRAARELERFYEEVLPRDLSDARRLTIVRLPQLAAQFDVKFDRREYSPPNEDRDAALRQLKADMGLAGRYSDIRMFIHQLESAPDFVVIDNIRLAEEDEETGLLELDLELSTYYRVPAR
jgi:Tfp pilus assembly protein PilO